MLEDKLLIWKLRHGKADALGRIYQKYKSDMLSLAGALLRDSDAGEDVVHDVFVRFAENAKQMRLRTSLRSYLLASVANKVRSIKRSKWDKVIQTDEFSTFEVSHNGPVTQAVKKELYQKIDEVLACLPGDQREVIILRLQSDLKFKEIAHSLGVSINTVQSRYRYGIDKLRLELDSEVTI